MAKFIIGIGSQRAGSTLLHRLLDECTDIYMHPIKELHYYDTLYKVRAAKVLVDFSQRQLDRELDRLVEAKQFGYIDKKYKNFIRANRILSTTPVSQVEYLDLYRPCVNEHEYLGEITPEYMILPEDGVAHLAKDLGSDTKIILISRDPTERFISAVKLLKNYNNPDYNAENFSIDLEDVYKNMPKWVDQQVKLNDYESAIVRYKKYFDSVLFISFERMISDANMLSAQLEEFLGIAVDHEKVETVLGTKVNALNKTANISEELKNVLSNRFLSNKAYLDDIFGYDD